MRIHCVATTCVFSWKQIKASSQHRVCKHQHHHIIILIIITITIIIIIVVVVVVIAIIFKYLSISL
jgi:heme/copper-type cytochrome/quinol oxidase subunit 2